MSLVATWAKADDGYFYKEPVLAAEGWFICFDDDDPIELVIKLSSHLTPEEIFKTTGIDAEVTSKNFVAGRLFSEDADDYVFNDGRSYWIEIHKPLPHKLITKFDERKKVKRWQDLPGEFAIYSFEDEKS